MGAFFGGANLQGPVCPAQTSLCPLWAEEDARPVGGPLGMFDPSSLVDVVCTAQRAVKRRLLDRQMFRDHMGLHTALVVVVVAEVARIDSCALRVCLFPCQRHPEKHEG